MNRYKINIWKGRGPDSHIFFSESHVIEAESKELAIQAIKETYKGCGVRKARKIPEKRQVN